MRRNVVKIRDHKITFSSTQDAQYSCAILESVEQYVFRYTRSKNRSQIMHVLVLIVACNSKDKAVVKHFFHDEERLGE